MLNIILLNLQGHLLKVETECHYYKDLLDLLSVLFWLFWLKSVLVSSAEKVHKRIERISRPDHSISYIRQGDEQQHYSNETLSAFRQLFVINTQDIHTNGAHFK